MTCAGKFTVKRLEGGGCEVEFPNSTYLAKVRQIIDARYEPTARWRDVNCQLEATLTVPMTALAMTSSEGVGAKSKSIVGGSFHADRTSRLRSRIRTRPPCFQIVVQLGSVSVGDRKMWILNGTGNGNGGGSAGNDPTNVVGRWIDSELTAIYETAMDMVAKGAHQIRVESSSS